MAGMYDDTTPNSQFEQVMRSIIDGTPYEHEPRSVMEALLIELKEAIESGGGGSDKAWIGITTTPLTDGSTTNPITINGESVTAKAGDITAYQNEEFIFNGSTWQSFGDLSGLVERILALEGDVGDLDNLNTETKANLVAAINEVLSDIPSLTNYIEKSQTAGLIKNDGTVDTNSYATTSELQQVAGSIPDELSDLQDDSTHRLVTDTEKSTWNGKQDALTFDDAPTESSDNPIKSGGVYTALSSKQDNLGATKDANNDVTFLGNVIDSAGNVLSEVSALEQSASGNPIIVNAQPVDAKELSVELEPIQDLHGYDHPWAGGANVNLLRPGEAKTVTSNGITVSSDGNGTYTVSGTATADMKIYFDCEEYTTPDGSQTTVLFKNTQDSYDIGFGFAYNNTDIDAWGLSPSDRKYTNYSGISEKTINQYFVSVNNGLTVNMTIQPMFVHGDVTSNPPPFSSYSNICPISGRSETSISTRNADNTDSHTATISFGQTVYGARIDFKTGVGIVTHALVTFDGSDDENWSEYTSRNGFKITISDMKSSAGGEDGYNNEFPFATSLNDFGVRYGLGDNQLGCLHITENIDSVTDLASWKAYLASNPLQVCYELATPTELTLTPANLTLLKGYNYITGDGEMELTYVPESISGYMEEVLVPISLLGTNESGRTTASRAYTTGEYFYKDQKMYKATTSIASGATLTLNTNYVEGDVGTALTNANTYATSEVEIGTWLGKRLYRKVIDFGALPNATTKAVSSGLSGITVRKMECVAVDNNGRTISVPYSSTVTAGSNISLVCSASNAVEITTASDVSSYSAYVVLEYTKN